MWFAYSLFSVFAWAGSDVFSKVGTMKYERFNHLRLVVMVGLVMGLHAVGFIILNKLDYSLFDIIRYLPVSFLYILSMVLGYVGLRYIALSVSSPVCNSSGAIAALLCFLLLKQSMNGLQLIAVCIISAGIFALSFFEHQQNKLIPQSDKKKRGFIALIFPILYCIIDGMGTTLDAYYLDFAELMTEDSALVSYELTFLIGAILALIYLFFIQKEGFHPKREGWFTLGAMCETAGQITYVYAISSNAIVAAPMIASYSVVSVLLSHIFLREKLDKKQYPVVILVLVAIVMLGLE